MATPHVWTAADDALLTAWHAAGKSLHSFAQEQKWAKSTLSKHSTRLGLTWDRERTAKAAEAKSIDAKDRRAALQLRALTRAEHLFDRLEADMFTTITRGQYGVEETEILTFVPPKDERDLSVTIRTYLDTAMRLDAHDSGTGATAVIGLLQQTALALGITDLEDQQAPE